MGQLRKVRDEDGFEIFFDDFERVQVKKGGALMADSAGGISCQLVKGDITVLEYLRMMNPRAETSKA